MAKGNGNEGMGSYQELLAGLRAAVRQHGLGHDDVTNAAAVALANQPYSTIFGAIREAAGEPDVVRALCDQAETGADFCSEDLKSVARFLGYKPV